MTQPESTAALSDNSAPEPQTDSLNFRRLLPILVIVLVDTMGITIIIPVLPFYALAFDASLFTIGLLGSSYPLMQFIFVPILGTLSDRIGRKPVLVVAQIGTFISLVTLGLAGSLWMLFLARIIDGITGANLATVQSAITDSTTPRNRAQGLGLIGATLGIGFIVGPVISGVALSLSGNNYSVPAFVAAGFALVSVLLTTFVFEETLSPAMRSGAGSDAGERAAAAGAPSRSRGLRRMWNGLRDPRLGTLFLLLFLLQTMFGMFTGTFAPFTLARLGLNSFGNAIFFATFGVALVVVQGGLVGPLARRFGERRMVFVGLALFSIGFALASFTWEQPVPWYEREALVAELSQVGTSFTEETSEQVALLPEQANRGWAALLYLLIGLLPVPVGFALIGPNLNSLITQRVGPREVGSALGLGGAFFALGSALGPALGGFFFDAIGIFAPFFINGIGGALLFVFALRRLRADEVPIEAI